MLRDTDYNPLTLLQKLVLLPLTKDRSLRILHIRQSGADCEQIGSWGIEDIYDYTGSELDSPAAEEPTQTERVVENYRGEDLTDSLENLAQWAFGPEGLLYLEVIAFGDFSYEGRYAKSQVFLVRNLVKSNPEDGVEQRTFRHMLRTDRWQKMLIDDNYTALAALPAGPILED
jgi:hypothetical protein